MKVLIIGLGSIGQRHADNFKQLGHEVAICSKRPQVNWKSFTDLENALKEFQPSHVVIANETSSHYSTLNQVLNSSKAQVLVEKPLFDHLPATFSEEYHQRIAVAYNMRFHPLLNEMKERLGSQLILAWVAYVGQHLSTWRPQRDYKDVYSSKRSLGGGVLRDLSHEIDMFQYIVGGPELLSSHGGKFSKLESDADDIFSLLVSGKNCPHGTIHMNCLDHLIQRRLTVITNTETIELDFIAGTLKGSQGTEFISTNKNESYLTMSKAFLENDVRLCSFKEGWEIMELIEQAERSGWKQ